MDTHMERTQIYIPRHLKRRLRQHALRLNRNVSDLLREGAERLLEEEEKKAKKDRKRFLKALHAAAGIWKDRTDIDFDTIRGRSNRTFPGWND